MRLVPDVGLMDEAGLSGGEQIFSQQDAMQQQQMMGAPAPAGGATRPAPSQITNPESVMRSINSPSLVVGELSKL